MDWPFDAETWAMLNNWALAIGVPVAVVASILLLIISRRER